MRYADQLSEFTENRVTVKSTYYSLECYHREAWELDTNAGTEVVSCDVTNIDPDTLPDDEEECNQIMLDAFGDYIEGNRIYSANRVSHWVANWTMPGYLDQGTEHTADTEAEALTQFLEYDGESDSWDDDSGQLEIPDNVMFALERLAELADDGDTVALSALQFHLPEMFQAVQ